MRSQVWGQESRQAMAGAACCCIMVSGNSARTTLSNAAVETFEMHSCTCLAIDFQLALCWSRLCVASPCRCLGFLTVWWLWTSPLSSGAAQDCKGKHLCQESGNHISSGDLDSEVPGSFLSSARPGSRGLEGELGSTS